MRVAQIAFKYGLRGTGGAAIASTRLHQAFLANGIESHYICVHQCDDGENVHVLPRKGTWRRRVYFALTKVLRCMWHFTPYRKSIVMNVIPLYGLERLLDEIKPDVVHIHWIIADVMAFEQIPKIKYPLVMHLHDLFNVNIYQPYPNRDKRFIEGVTSENSTRLERWLFNRKRTAICSAHPSFIGPSQWICSIGASSLIGKGLRFETVPNIIDSTFSYDSSDKRANKKFVILFGASSVVMCLDPRQELESQFNNCVKRGFVKRESGCLAQMERSIKRQFQEAAILFQRREFEIKYKDYKVSLPFCFGGDIGIRAVKPLDFGKQIKDVVAECLKWRYCAEQLQEVSSGIQLLCPTRFPDKGSSTYQAMQDILGGNDALNLYQYVEGDEELKNKLIKFARSA